MTDSTRREFIKATAVGAGALLASPSRVLGANDRVRMGIIGAGARGVELVLTVTGTAEATDWRAEVVHGGKRIIAALPVPASAVGAAAKDLHPDIAEAIDTVLSTAREHHRTRVEQLRAELEAARHALAELET